MDPELMQKLENLKTKDDDLDTVEVLNEPGEESKE